MKTILPESITTVEEAKAYLDQLCLNSEAYHCDDPARDCFDADECTDAEAEKMDELMQQIFVLIGNPDHTNVPMLFDPYAHILNYEHRDKKFMWKDHSGKEGAISDISFSNLNPADEDDTNDDNQTIYEWAKEAEIGHEWTGYNETYTRTA